MESVELTRASDRVLEHGVMIPMRDGARLAADVWRPASGSAPVLVARTPYGREVQRDLLAPERLVAAGFAVILQDCRGRFDSEGDWEPLEVEILDGYDTVEWAAAQPWSNGRVGMFGASYLGHAQWLAAVAQPPHLVAVLPETAATDFWDAYFGPGGAFRLANRFGWAMAVAPDTARRRGIDDPLLRAIGEIRQQGLTDVGERTRLLGPLVDGLIGTRPLRSVAVFEHTAPWYSAYFDRERRDDPYWTSLNPGSHIRRIDLPMIHVGGWYDVHLGSTFAAYLGMKAAAPSERARAHQRLIVGPWVHWTPENPVVGSVDFGPAATLGASQLRSEWFGHWLADRPSPLLDAPPIRLFVMGENAWRDEWEWPLARMRPQSWYLHSAGHANDDDGDGRLDLEPPREEPSDHFVYDPADPVPTRGGRTLGVTGSTPGVFDQRDVEGRADVLLYTSAVLAQPLELTGPVSVELWASTSAPDTDFTAKLVEVRADGSTWNICDGIVRARTAVPTPLQSGAIYRFTIDLVATSILVAAGNRIRVHVSSSNFPMFEPNPNTGNPLGSDTAADLRTAQQTIHHDARHPSRIILPVVPR